MSKVVITVDSETNELSVSVDGVNVENVNSASVSRYMNYYEPDEGPEVHVYIASDDKVGDMKRTTYLMCKESSQSQELVRSGDAFPSKKHKNMLESEAQPKVRADIHEFFGKGKRK